MNLRVDDETLATMKFGIGQPVRRNEDVRLIQGQGQYTDDVNLKDQAHAAMVRSSVAHGNIRKIDTSVAANMPGVLAVYTGADLEKAGYADLAPRLPFKSTDGTPMHAMTRPVMSQDKVRYVGDPLVCVIAETETQARDAAEAVVVDIENLPAVIEASDAVKPGAPLVYEAAKDNVGLTYSFGDAKKVEEAFARAAHVTTLNLIDNRIVINPMEPRSAVAAYDQKSERFTLYGPTQGVLGSRANTAELLKVPVDKVRFVSVNVGGSFGMKGSIFPEYICALHGARALGRPVKITDQRSESFVSDHHGRDQEFLAELALAKDGTFLALRFTGFGNLGAYVTAMGPLFSTLNIVKHAISLYRTPLIQLDARCVFTHTVPVTAYRGAGRPEGNYYMERLVDTAAREMGIDPVKIRRKNHIRKSQIPYKAKTGSTYDSGDFPVMLDKALELADWKGFNARKRESAKRGKLRGRGIGQFLEVTAPIGKELGAIKFEKDGGVTISTGTHDHGQGHWTTFAQVLNSQLGVPFDKIRLMQTDSDALIGGAGTGGSKSIMNSGTAIFEASEKVVEKGKAIASHLLEAGVGDIEFNAGNFAIAGTDRSISIMEIAQKLNEGVSLPKDAPTSLDVDHLTDPGPATFPNGCHICEVEVDPETGITEVVKYSMVGDFGT
ncbi:MAG: xanthine dehydrogenase family protein molybdopterin-binding subunit, partial [Beijerinckiaceae bacterium]|nr:xanthine dehydrogenase family protein molybdopterin-binding subunit [Beijerinckiaceae bacterium]